MRLRKRKWMDPFLEEENDLLLHKEDLPSFFKDDKKYFLEIGFGKGGFLYQKALNDPNNEYVGIEVDRLVVAIALKTYLDSAPKNLHFILSDVNNLFEDFKPSFFEAIYLNFSDPWPKKRQHKRRLTYPTFLEKYETVLKNGGKIYFKTDNEGLFIDSIKYFQNSKFIIETIDEDYMLKDDDIATEYETKFRAEGKKIYRLIARKDD